jgi:hypothetical protein
VFVGIARAPFQPAAAHVDGGLSQSQITEPSSSAAQAQTSPPAAPMHTWPSLPGHGTLSASTPAVQVGALAGLSLNGEFEKSHAMHIQVEAHMQLRVPESAKPQGRFGQLTPSAVQAMFVLMPLHSAPVAAPPVPAPAVALPPVAGVPAVLGVPPAAAPAVLGVPPEGITPPPAPALGLPADAPPAPSSGVSALEQPAVRPTSNPTDAMPAYTLIMESSLFETRVVHEVRRRPSPLAR